MATIERIEPAWTPVSGVSGGRRVGAHSSVDEDEYTGKHRKPGRRLLAFSGMFYTGRRRKI